MTEYVVQPGDTLWKIANQFYGTGSKWTIIWEENRDQIPNPDQIKPGQVIIIPDND